MHLGIFLYGLTWGGATRRLLSLARAFQERGHKISLIVVEKGGDLDASETAGLRVVELPKGPLFRFFLASASKKRKMGWSKLTLARFLRGSDLDVLLSGANHAHITAILAMLLSGRRIPLVLRLSNHIGASLLRTAKPSKRLRFLLVRWLYPRSDMIIAVCRDIARDLVSRIPVPWSRVRVIYNPVYSPALLRKAEEKPHHPWLEGERGRAVPVLLAAGRLSPQKAFPILVRAFGIAHSRKAMRLIILGEGKDRPRVEGLISRLGLGDSIDMPGFVQNPVAFMARADLFCHASAFEGMPGAVIEALAAGCPVVCTDAPGGARELLENGRYGILVPPGDEKALADGIMKGLDRSWDSAELRNRAAFFSIDGAADEYLEVLEDLAEKG